MGQQTLTHLYNHAKTKFGLMQIEKEFIPFLEYVKAQKPTNFLEIGTSQGGTFYVLSQIVSGEAISIDLPNGIFGGIPPEQTTIRNRNLIKECKQIRFLAQDSHNLDTIGRVKQILNGRKLGLLFIDGDHTYNGVLLDYLLYSNFVVKGGLIVFHDIKLHKNPNCNVSKVWSQLEGDKKEFIDLSEAWGGIGVLKVER